MTNLGEGVHSRNTGKQTLVAELEELHTGVLEHALENRTRDEWRLVAGPKEQCNKRIHHLLPELMAEAEHPQHRVYGYKREEDLGLLDDTQHLAELLDIGLELLGQGRGKDVGPEVFALGKGDLHPDGRGIET